MVWEYSTCCHLEWIEWLRVCVYEKSMGSCIIVRRSFSWATSPANRLSKQAANCNPPRRPLDARVGDRAIAGVLMGRVRRRPGAPRISQTKFSNSAGVASAWNSRRFRKAIPRAVKLSEMIRFHSNAAPRDRNSPLQYNSSDFWDPTDGHRNTFSKSLCQTSIRLQRETIR